MPSGPVPRAQKALHLGGGQRAGLGKLLQPRRAADAGTPARRRQPTSSPPRWRPHERLRGVRVALQLFGAGAGARWSGCSHAGCRDWALGGATLCRHFRRGWHASRVPWGCCSAGLHVTGCPLRLLCTAQWRPHWAVLAAPIQSGTPVTVAICVLGCASGSPLVCKRLTRGQCTVAADSLPSPHCAQLDPLTVARTVAWCAPPPFTPLHAMNGRHHYGIARPC